MPKLSNGELKAALAEVPEWSEVSGTIQRTFQFADFVSAMAFVTGAAFAAERAQHHPDIMIRYNKVTLTLSTHDAGAITEKDFSLAKTMDGIYSVTGGGTRAEQAVDA
jgi:4a-hydroxytetrahydrobiopterin dehydratase